MTDAVGGFLDLLSGKVAVVTTIIAAIIAGVIGHILFEVLLPIQLLLIHVLSAVVESALAPAAVRRARLSAVPVWVA